jgi:RNA 2',3'-cyclic 3'-phosphodiesterase
MRLFIALDIDDGIRERISRFVEGIRNFSPDARWVREESLHITLKFIGEQADEKVEVIQRSLDGISARPPEIHFCGYGYFPNPKSARVFWVGMKVGPELGALATAIDDRMPALGISREERAFSPHLTLARISGGSGSPRWRKGDGSNRTFQRLQEQLSALPEPEFGSMTAREFFLYQSQLSPKGSKYSKLARFPLG